MRSPQTMVLVYAAIAVGLVACVGLQLYAGRLMDAVERWWKGQER